MGRKLWTAPMLSLFGGNNSVPTVNGFQSLTEYLRGHIGFWGSHTGTTNGNGYITLTHDCGFEPDSVQVTHIDTTGAADKGAFHINSLNATTLVVHFLRKNGTNSVGVSHSFYYHILPKVTER